MQQQDGSADTEGEADAASDPGIDLGIGPGIGLGTQVRAAVPETAGAPLPTGVPTGSRPRAGPRWRTVLGSATFVIAATILQLLRQDGVALWRTVWAEDGRIFYGQALEHPLRELILEPYAGYGLVLPRILGSIGSELSPSQYARCVAVSSTVIVALLALFVYFASERLLRAPLRRAVLAGSIVLLPTLPFEVLGALCNLQWTLPIACLFAVAFPVQRGWAVAVRLPIVVLAPLSSPLCLVFAPIAVYQLVAFARGRRTGTAPAAWTVVLVPLVYLVACLGQFLVYRSAPQFEQRSLGASESVEVLARLYPTRVSTDLVFGVEVTKHLWSSFGYGVAAVASLVLVVLLGGKFARSAARTRWWMAVLVVAALGIFGFSMLSRPEVAASTVISGTGDYTFLGSRYAVVPALLVILALLLPPELGARLLTDSEVTAARNQIASGGSVGSTPAGGVGSRLTGGLPWHAVVVVTGLWLVVAVIPSYRIQNYRSLGPSWPEQIQLLRQACEDDPTITPVLTTSPTAAWQVELTCSEIAS